MTEQEKRCPLCGNMTNVEIEITEGFPYVPKSKIKQRIKDLESYWVIERGNYPEWVKQGLEELKGLLESQ